MIHQSGIEFIHQSLGAIEAGRIREPGVYRCCGVSSKVQKLLDCALDPSNEMSLDLSDELEWETNTICCAIKKFLRDLSKPLIPCNLCVEFIKAAKSSNLQECILLLRICVQKLPGDNKGMLERIIRHLKLVSDHASENLMTARNLAMCFGPTLLRLCDDEKMNLFDLKLRNTAVEVLISHYSEIFEIMPRQRLGSLFVSNDCRKRLSILPARTLSASTSTRISGNSSSEPLHLISTSDVFACLRAETAPLSAALSSCETLPRGLVLSSPKLVKTKHPPHSQTPAGIEVKLKDRCKSEVSTVKTSSPADGIRSSGASRIWAKLRETLSLRKLIMYFHARGEA